MANESNCKNCKFYVQMRYLLNFRCYKFCIERISEWLKDFLVPLDSYLEHETAKCESFFVIQEQECRSLDNPFLDDMKNVKTQEIIFYFLDI